MNSTYAQKSSTVQKAADTKAASVLDSSAQSESLQRKADMANNATQRAEAPRPNNTGMPDNLKAGIESLSGFSMDNVRVHYNSSKPATVQALAYTQGTDIHIAPGQEKYLPHEAWHVAQQMAGRVSPTTNINGMPVNDNAALEHEADVMGEKAVQCKKNGGESLKNVNAMSDLIQCAEHIDVKEENIGYQNAEYGKALVGTAKSAPTAPYHNSLPHIAFETMAGGKRVDELKSVYENAIKNYNGAASVYMGVNACADYYYQEGDFVWVLNGESNTVVPDIDVTSINKYHSLTKIPFTWHLVGLGTKKNTFYTNENGAENLRLGTKPKSVDEKKIKGKKYTVDEYQVEKGYTFPFFEARALLMNYAAQSGADLYRWIDSDVKNDVSIGKINENGYAAFVGESEKEEIVEEFYSDSDKVDYDAVCAKITVMNNALSYVASGDQVVDRLKDVLPKLVSKKNEIDKKIKEKTEKKDCENGNITNLKKQLKIVVDKCVKKIFEIADLDPIIKKELCKDYVLNNGGQIFSGCYEWRDDVGLADGFGAFLQEINSFEKKVRLSYWNIYCENVGAEEGKVVGPFVFHERTGYIPEPIVYMNSLAHHGYDEAKEVDYEAPSDSALYKLSHPKKKDGDRSLDKKKVRDRSLDKKKEGDETQDKKKVDDGSQDREADVAFNKMRTSFIPEFSVSKPAKQQYFKDVIKAYSEMMEAKDPAVFIRKFREILTSVRQTSYKSWTFDDTTKSTLFEQKKNELVEELWKECHDFFGERNHFAKSITIDFFKQIFFNET